MTNQHSTQGGQPHKCKVPKCPYRHDQPQQQESWRDRLKRFLSEDMILSWKTRSGEPQSYYFDELDDDRAAKKQIESFLQSELELLEKKVKGEGLSLKQGQRVTCETGCNFNDVGGYVCQRHQSLTTQKES